MRSLATFKTNSLAAFTCGCFLESTNFLDVAVAAYTWTPLQIGVYVNVDISLELKVLLVDFLRAESTNIIVFEHFTASNSHTGDIYDISVADFYLKMFGKTALTEFVIARKAEESVIRVLLVANNTFKIWNGLRLLGLERNTILTKVVTSAVIRTPSFSLLI